MIMFTSLQFFCLVVGLSIVIMDLTRYLDGPKGAALTIGWVIELFLGIATIAYSFGVFGS